ncbi:MAG: hypothetical protein PUE32_02790 [Clostridia bacterium]|nr:hypothetical protein [Clostridia bacterium]
MYYLLELREKMKKVYASYNVYIRPAVKFLLALLSFILLNASIGYMSKLNNPFLSILLSVLCAFLPGQLMILVLSLFMMAHLYAISAELAVIALCVLVVMYLLYLRFAPKMGYVIIITVMMCGLKLYAAVPIIIGIGLGAASIVPVSFGMLVYVIVKTASEYEAALTNSSVTDTVQHISYLAESFVNDRAFVVMVLAAVVTIIVIACIKKMTIDNAWTYALIAGAVVEFLIYIVGILALHAKFGFVSLILGLIIGIVGGYVCKVLLFSVDYKRTEYVQFEDDEYYYYVKAVPKVTVVNEDVRVKQINGKKTKKAEAQPVRRSPRPMEFDDDDDDSITFDK